MVVSCVAFCMLFGNDPAGGARFSVDSLGAGMIGAIAGIPMIALRHYLWNGQGLRKSAVIEEMTSRKAEDLGPIVAGLSAPQRAAVIFFDAATVLSLMLVALMGCINSSLTVYSHLAQENLGLPMPDELPFVVAVAVSSLLYGMSQFAATSISDDEASIVEDAMENADRYYRVVAMSDETNGDPRMHAVAFKAVAQDWFSQNQAAALLSGVLGFFDILYLGVLWQFTGDLTAPAVVAYLVSAVDYTFASRHDNVVRDGR